MYVRGGYRLYTTLFKDYNNQHYRRYNSRSGYWAQHKNPYFLERVSFLIQRGGSLITFLKVAKYQKVFLHLSDMKKNLLLLNTFFMIRYQSFFLVVLGPVIELRPFGFRKC